MVDQPTNGANGHGNGLPADGSNPAARSTDAASAARIPVANGLPNGFRSLGLTAQQAQLLEQLAANQVTLRDQLFQAVADPRRSMEAECGYPDLNDSVSVDLFRALYDRDAIGSKIVELMPNHCWQATPTVFEDEGADKATPFEEAWDALEVGISTGRSWHQDEEGGTIWSYLKRADVLSGIGSFGVLLLGIDDGRNLQDPVEGVVTFNHKVTVRNVLGEEWIGPYCELLRMGNSAPIKEEVEALTTMVKNGTVVVNRSRWDMPSKDGKDPGGYRCDPEARKATFLNDWMTTAERRAERAKDGPTANAANEDMADPPPANLDYFAANADAVPSVWRFEDERGVWTVRRTVDGLTSDRPLTANAWSELASELLGRPVLVEDAADPLTANDAWGESTGDAGYGHNSPRKFAGSPGQGPQQPKAGYGNGGTGPTSRARGKGGDFLRGQGIDPAQARFQDGQQGNRPRGGPPNAPRSNTPGTDEQYAWQGAMPPAALAGTDQQYFGIYFGPSEAFPNDGPTGRPTEQPTRKLVFLRPFDESLVQVVRYEWNIRNPRFGMPVMYRITLNDPREQHSGVGLPMATVFVHWSRVIHLADNLQSSEIFGRPRMRVPLNNVLGLRKIYGAGPEGYWKSAFTGYSFETNPQLGGDVLINKPDLLDQFELYQNSLQRALVTSGMTVKTLAPSVQDPGGQVTVQIQAICIHLDCPQRVFMGSERGELASSQDDSQWNDVKRARCLLYLTPKVICPFVDRLIAVGVLPEPEGYTVRWPDLEAMSDAQKAAILLQRTQAYAAYVSGNLESTIPPLDFMTRFDDMEEEEAQEIIDAAKQAHEDQDTMTMPPQIAGHDQEPPEGSKEAGDQQRQAAQFQAQQQQQQDQFQQQMDHEDQQADRQAGIQRPDQPNQQDAQIAAQAKAQAARQQGGPKMQAGQAPSFKARVGNLLTNSAEPDPELEQERALIAVAKEAADRKDSPDYGQLFLNTEEQHAWYVTADGDEEEFAKWVHDRLEACPLVQKVTVDAEAFPPRDGGWLMLWPKVKRWGYVRNQTGKGSAPKRTGYDSLPSSQEQDVVLANRLEALQARVWRAREWLGNLKRLAGVE